MPPFPRHNSSYGALLSVRTTRTSKSNFYPILLSQAIGSYEGTLLTLSTSLHPVPSDADYEQLRLFKRLKTLEVSGAHETALAEFKDALKEMDSLEALSVRLHSDKVEPTEFVSCFLSFSHLKSLGLKFSSNKQIQRPAPLPSAAGLTQLTKLTLSVPGPVNDLLASLPQLRHLESTVWHWSLDASVVWLPSLETLCVRPHTERTNDHGHRFSFSTESLSGLMQLRTLKLGVVDVSEGVGTALASLPELTKLIFRDWSGTTSASRRAFFSSIGTMRSLEELGLSFSEELEISCDIFPQHFPTLKKLALAVSKEQAWLVRRKLAAVPQLQVGTNLSF